MTTAAEKLNVDPAEIARFEAAASRWWDPQGEMRPLHDLNPVRLQYVERAGPLVGRKVLDVGCGGGLLAEAMARKGAKVTGLDLADDLLQVARLHALEAGIEVDYQLESAEQHVVAHAGDYEIATCMEMLEHVPDPTAVIDALARLVRPGGHIFVSTLNRTLKSYAMAVVGAEYVLRLLPTGTHTYEKFIRPSELRQWARAAGLTVTDIAGLDYDPFSRKARLSADASVNYLMHLRRGEVERSA
ncbi:MAG TPA: bifunctional 2-polyprenyl-6-hydroxyphenol methylase/3-demethylubiquinol 3-O-methyltransferase UbiG [Steroidobacteraceae bacterium]|nr:bifunctional 2-polyprenyl-6-hydroxyphenol methylase/3-demethylubiquinol 3-O-methyltransferase UbiG [Steroidobacteraceae bacterium]